VSSTSSASEPPIAMRVQRPPRPPTAAGPPASLIHEANPQTRICAWEGDEESDEHAMGELCFYLPPPVLLVAELTFCVGLMAFTSAAVAVRRDESDATEVPR
jgi:hypothetical protein